MCCRGRCCCRCCSRCAVCHRVLDGELVAVVYWFWFKGFLRLHSITIDLRCIVRQYRRIYDIDLPTYYFLSLVVTVMHGVNAGVSTPMRISPCKHNY